MNTSVFGLPCGHWSRFGHHDLAGILHVGVLSVLQQAVHQGTGGHLAGLGVRREDIVDAVGGVAFGIFVILPIAISLGQALWTRLSTFSPRTAAKIAIENSALPSGAPPTLVPPP